MRFNLGLMGQVLASGGILQCNTKLDFRVERFLRMSFDRILGIVGVVLAVLGIAVAIAMDPKSRGELVFSIGCFILSGLLLCLTVGVWGFFGSKSAAKRILVSISAFVVICLSLVGACRWANGRYKQAGTEKELQLQSRPQEPRGEESKKESPKVENSPISKSSSFSTMVPLATISVSRPIKRIPFDENLNDPKVDFYRDLGTLSQRPFENPPGITFQEKPLRDANVARIFTAELLQYYILHEIRVLQHGTLGLSVTKFLGKETAVAKPIDVPPVPVPDPVPYSIKNLFRALEGNEFLNVYTYGTTTKDAVETPHWVQIERTDWQSREHPFQVPSGTVISFSGNDHDPERNVRLERPGFYKLKFAVVPLFGSNGSLPEDFYTNSPGVDSYSCRITMDYEIQRRTDGGFSPQLHAQWADSLFTGMKRAMAP
jgi:hypothetical protein